MNTFAHGHLLMDPFEVMKHMTMALLIFASIWQIQHSFITLNTWNNEVGHPRIHNDSLHFQ